MRREPLLIPAVALAAGVLVGHFIYFRLRDLAIPSLAVLVLLAGVFWFRRSRWIRLAAICLALALGGIATQSVHRLARLPKLDAADGETVLLDGCVTNPPVFSPGREQFTLALTPKSAARITVALKGGSQKLALGYGQKIEIPAKIRLPRNYGNPDAFDYEGYLAAQGIFWNGSVSDPKDIKVLPGPCGSRAVGWLFGIRTWALGRLDELYPNDIHTAGLLKATLLGETSGVERRWTSDFRVTGTYHALVISGLHISVLALSILFLLRILTVRRIPALCIASIACWLYTFISGLNPPAIRSASGFTLFFVASCCFRRTRVLNLLAAVGIVYLTVAPDALFDPSFQLSFLSAATIAAFAVPLIERTTEPVRLAIRRLDQVGYDPLVQPRAAEWRIEFRLLARTLQAWTRLPRKWAERVVVASAWAASFMFEAVIVSACVQFGLALPMIAYFHRLSVTGLSANIIVVPILMAVVPLGFASIITGSRVMAVVTKALLEASEWVAGWHVHFEPSWRMAAIPFGAALAFAISLVLLGVAVRHGKRFVAPAFACSLALFCLICLQPWRPVVRPGMLELTAIDVNQGDSLLLVFPNGKTMLIDAGGFPGMSRMARKPQLDMGEDVVSPYLWGRRIHHLDYAVLTHGHSDHMAGLPAILDNFHPDSLWIGAEPPTEEWKEVEQRAAADHVPIIPLTRASRLADIGGAHLRVLAPTPDYAPDTEAGNNDSLVLEVTYGRRSILLTGDAERPVEEELVTSGQLRPVTLLKVGHHGSRTSSSEDFLDQLQPRFAFISDGYLNQFHHPHQTVLDRLARRHTAIFRTDQRGLLTFRTDGDKVELETFH